MPLSSRVAASLVSASLLFGACAGAPPRPVAIDAGPVGSSSARAPTRDGDYANAVRSQAVWDALAFRSPTAALPGTEVVKIVHDRSDGQTYFLQSERWPIHYFFARRFLSTAAHPVGDEVVFNRREYHRPDRRFVLGSLSRYPGDVWAFELYAGDELSLDETARAFQLVRDRVFFSRELRYRPVPLAHDGDPRTRALLPVVESSELFSKVTFQPLELGTAYGYVRVFPPGRVPAAGELRPFDLVVLGTLPEDLPVVAGVISEEIQAPLGHINVLCHNRKTPNLYAKAATSRDDVRGLEGKLAKLVVTPLGFTLTPATQAEAEAGWERSRPKEITRPARDDRDVGMPGLEALTLGDVPRVGAKAAQLGLVTQLGRGRFRVPRGFALPMSAYAEFLRANGLDRRVEAMLREPAFARDPAARKRALDDLRAAMEAAPVPASIVDGLSRRIAETLPPGKVRLRSSTNSEDLPGFNGAGLYRSTRVDPADRADVERGLKKVWSSVWLLGAEEERRYYRIDSATVGMAILVQESVDDDVINGVAITANPFSQGQPGFFVNAQLSRGEGSVTGARGNEIPEQVMLYHYEDGNGVERMSASSRAGGRPLLSAEDLTRLRAALAAIHEGFTGDTYGMSGKAADVEFLIAGPRREVVIVQARPYQVEWVKERRWLDDSGQPLAPRPR
ncbi:MAG: hypothetical protein IT374_16000 [Polyangiaceae bacterium]|nr:hypothetical protein [Polyangiaceae bacterium]